MAKECEVLKSNERSEVKNIKFSSKIEIDESYFGSSKRVRGKRGRGVANKTPVFRMTVKSIPK